MKILNKINSIINKKYFYEAMLGVDLVFAILGWFFFSSAALLISAIFCVGLLYITKTFKYSLPFGIQILFVFNGEFTNGIDLAFVIIAGCILLCGFIIYFIINGFSFKKCRMKWSFLAIAIATLIPIFYAQIPEKYTYAYYYYFQWFLYFLVYIIIANLIEGDMTLELSKSLGTIGCLMAVQCIYKGLILGSPWYFVGWGHANYADFMMILFLPLLAYVIIKEDKVRKIIYICEVLLILVGCYATKSRGFYLFFTLEAGLMFLYFTIKYKKFKLLTIVASIGVLLVGGVFIIPQTRAKIMSLMAGDATYGFFSGRLEIWKLSWEAMTESPRSIIIGHGVFTWISDQYSGGYEVIQLAHNTIIHSLLMMGVVGIFVMGYHFYMKYTEFKGDKSLFGALLLIAFITNECYGMVDNVYHTYFYCCTLAVILATYEARRRALSDNTQNDGNAQNNNANVVAEE